MTIYRADPDIHVRIRDHSGRTYTLPDCVVYQSNRVMEKAAAHANVIFKGDKITACLDNPSLVGKYYWDVLEPYSNVELSMVDAKGKRWVDVYGVLEEPMLSRPQMPDDSTRLSVKGLGDCIENTRVFWHAAMRSAERSNIAGSQFLRRVGIPDPGPPDHVCRQIFRGWFNDSLPLTLADGRRLEQALRLSFSEFKDSMTATPLKAMNMEGSVWQAMVDHSDAPFGEMFIQPLWEESQFLQDFDLQGVDNQGYLPLIGVHLRPTPFLLPRWDALANSPGWNFSYQDGERRGAGEQISFFHTREAYSWFWCFGQHWMGRFDQLLKVFNDSGGKIPVWLEDMLKKYGYRKYEAGTRYVEALKESGHSGGKLTPAQIRNAQNNKKQVTEQLAQRTAQLALMFGYDRMASGSVEMRGRIGMDPEHGIRCGSVLTRKESGHQFYINGITQSWDFRSASWSTVANLTRGIEPKAYREWYSRKEELIGLVQDGVGHGDAEKVIKLMEELR